MPELAEVEHARRQWAPGMGERVERVLVPRPTVRVLRGVDVPRLERALAGATLVSAEARGKQLLFGFARRGARGGASSARAAPAPAMLWLGVHLGMRGRLSSRPRSERGAPERHDLLVVRQATRDLVFTDLRHFGRVRVDEGPAPPDYWTGLPPEVASSGFTRARFDAFLARRGRRALKPLLLEQSVFPGVGNWMADEILWRAGEHPETTPAELDDPARARLYRAVRHVAREAVRLVDDTWGYPATWLFSHRWADGGRCPRCGEGLVRVQVGGRTTAFCPGCQPARQRTSGSSRAGSSVIPKRARGRTTSRRTASRARSA